MSSSSNNIATLSDVKVKLSEDETEWEHVQVRDKHVVHSKLLEACLSVEMSRSKLMRDRLQVFATTVQILSKKLFAWVSCTMKTTMKNLIGMTWATLRLNGTLLCLRFWTDSLD